MDPQKKNLELLRKKKFIEDFDPDHKDLSPNRYKKRAQNEEDEHGLNYLFQDENNNYRKKFQPEISNFPDDIERVWGDQKFPQRKKKFPKNQRKKWRLEKFNTKYKGNYQELEVKGYKGIFENPDYQLYTGNVEIEPDSLSELEEEDSKKTEMGSKKVVG